MRQGPTAGRRRDPRRHDPGRRRRAALVGLVDRAGNPGVTPASMLDGSAGRHEGGRWMVRPRGGRRGSPTLGLVLSGGGARGAFQVGVHERLLEDPRFAAGPTVVTGTS